MGALRAGVLFWLIWNIGLLSSAVAQNPLRSPAYTVPEVQVALTGRDPQPENAGAETLQVTVEIPPDHHGYLDTGDEGFFIPLSFASPGLTEQGGQLLLVSQPVGERDEVVRATVLRGKGEFVVRLEAPPGASLTALPPLILRSQICNDVTRICYPPQEVAVLSFPGTGPGESPPSRAVNGPAGASGAGTLTLNERLTGLFRRYTDNLLLAFGLVLIAGLLASATPCVYPMLPITAAIFTARGGGSWQRGWLHALVYVVGLVGFYALLGLMAAATGTALSVLMTNAWVHLGFAALFTYLGLGMLGFYELRLFSSLMSTLDTVVSRWRGFSGTFCMGATAGLVVSPCVGPITGAILLEVTGQVASAHTTATPAGAGGVLRGVLLMTSFGCGLGLPFLVIGMVSSKLPSAGYWLTRTQYLLAIPTLYFAYTYYVKGMDIAAIPLNVAHTLLVGIVVLSAAVFVGLVQTSQSSRLRRVISAMLLILSLSVLYNGLARAGLSLSQGGAQYSASPVEVHQNLQWWRDLSLAQQRARAEGKPLFIDFYATWCANCKAFQQLTLSDAQFNAALQEVILVKIYDTDAVFRTLQQDPRYPELRGVGGQPLLPLFAIYSAQGALFWKGQDYQAVHTMMAQLEHARRVTIP